MIPGRARLFLGAICGVAWLAAVATADRSPAAMEAAANRFLASLTPDQRQQAALPFSSDDRERFHYIPTETFPRRGLTIGAMSEAQRKLAHGLLQSALSERGYLTATAVMDLETVLRAIEQNGRLSRDPERYFFSVFGVPASKGAWGWRVEGHHLSLNFTVVHGRFVASSPSFFGSNPAEVRHGPRQGLRVLAAEEDHARALLQALDESQRAKAIIGGTAPADIQTVNHPRVDPLSPAGITADALRPDQRERLVQLIEVYTSTMAPDIAADRKARLRAAGIEKIAFAWAGDRERGKQHYYRVQGPTFLIEFDNTQNDGNHVHSVWRDFRGDFGRDLLREHLQTVAH